MSDPEKLEKVKKEIRSLLISFQNGCSLYEFKRTFGEFLGKKLPSAEFGFHSDVEFLKSLYDVVDIQASGRDYYLYGIADEKSQHIQKLVCKQKSTKRTSKLSRSFPVRPVRSLNLPPRLSRRVPQVSYNAKYASENTGIQRYISESTESQKRTSEYTHSQRRASEYRDSQKSASEHTDGQRHASEYADGILPKKDLINLVHNASWDGISLTDFLSRYQQTYRKPFSFKQFGFSSLRACIESISELTLVTGQHDVVIYDSAVAVKILKNESKKLQQQTSSPIKYDDQYFNNDDRWTQPVSQASLQKEKENTYSASAFHSGTNVKQDKHKYDEWIHTVSDTSFQFGKENEYSSKRFHSERLEKDDFSASERKQFSSVQIPASISSNKMDAIEPIEASNVTRIIPENIKINFKKVALENRQGILAKNFLSRYEEITSTRLNLHSLGYSTLIELIDDVPDIFVRQLIFGSKKDWIIYPADSNPKGLSLESTHNQVLTIELIKRNIKGILEACPEGVKFHEFLHLYSLNCNDALCLKELGFDNLEKFLLSIANSISLKIEVKDGCKMIYLLEEPIRGPTQDYVFSREVMPSDIVSYDSTYAVQELPKDLDLSKFFPIYTSSISNPSLLYIQLPTDTDDLNILGDELDIFYKSSQGDKYMMKNAHIRVGAVCAALWPVDQLWYRAQILSIASLEFVKVFYVDYGTTCEIPTTNLRYLKKEFFQLSAQALRSQLACVKPKNGTSWTKSVMVKLLELCRDKRLMARIQDITDNGILSLIICDTTGDEDVFINDKLIDLGLAEIGEYKEADSALQNSASFPAKPGSPVSNDLASALTLQAQILQAWAIAAATNSSETHGNLVKQMSMLNLQQASVNPSQQGLHPGMAVNPFLGAVSPSIPNAAVGNPFLSAIAPNLPNPLIGTTPNYDFTKFPAAGSVHEQHINKPSNELMNALDDFENDIFDDDDDDESFQLFCKKVEVKSFPNKRFVKRVDLGDGYRIHLIIYDAKPYSSGGDISTIIWMNKDSDYMNRMLQAKETSFGETIVSEEGNDELFRQMDLYKVKGVQKITGSKSSVLLYPFANIIKILNLYGHPSVVVRTKLIEENSQFRLGDPIWQEFPDEEKIEDISSSPLMAITDDDKITQMCLMDLMAMKEGICCRRIRLMKRLSTQSANPKAVDEVDKMDQLLSKVLNRIKVIRNICSHYV